ncbi:hypothetical protein [Ruegeria sp.]|uniref:hypothetical protein n=1 Tax=Ruegeria sp. TaxID=1879320 RepID=UPI003B5BFAA6
MLIGRIENATRFIGKSQGFLGLPIRDEIIECPVFGPGTPRMLTAWQPTPDEVAAIKAGASIHVSLHGTIHPPIMLSVGQIPAD